MHDPQPVQLGLDVATIDGVFLGGGNATVNLTPVLVNSIAFGYDAFNLAAFRVHTVTGDFQAAPPSVPEPTTMVLLGTGLVGLVARKRAARA